MYVCKYRNKENLKKCNYLTSKVNPAGYYITNNFCSKRCKGNPEPYVKNKPHLPKLPSKSIQVKNAAKALVKNIINGFQLVNLLVRDERFRICNKCPHLTHKLLLRCSKCGCSLKLKTRLESESCPLGKW